MSNVSICSISELIPNGNNAALFGNVIRSDSFSVDFVFYKRHQVGYGPSLENFDLSLKDFSLAEVKDTYMPVVLDPGRKSVLTAVIGLGSRKQIRTCSTKEYYHMTSSTRNYKKSNENKRLTGIDLIESNIPTPKASSLCVYKKHVLYMLTNMGSLFDFYNRDTAKDHFSLYQDTQRATEDMAKILTHGTAKHNRKR